MKYALLAASAAALFVAPAAGAATVVVTPGSGWQAESGNAGTATITGAQARNGGGSLELRGDRTRYYTGASGNNLGGFLAPSLMSLSSVTALTFDWRIAGDTVSPLNPDYTPALRLIIRSGTGTTVRELIWEGAYNGVYGPQTVPDTWYSTTAAGKFYISGSPGNENSGKTIAEWAVSNASWNVVGISVGQGSSAGANYHAFADNVTLTTTSGSTTYNFETTATTPAVPEPATWGLMLAGFGLVGAGLRARRRTVRFA